MIFRYTLLISDCFRLFAKLTGARLVNYIKIVSSFYLSRVLNRVIVWGGPFALHFETAAVCNLRCPECLAGQGKLKRTHKLSDPEIMERKLWFYGRTAFYCNLYFQGEPFLHPRLESIISLVHAQGMYTVISTNGHFLSLQNCRMLVNSGLDRLIISLDGPDSDSYSQYRVNGDFDTVVQGIKRMVETRDTMKSRKPLVVVQQLVTQANEHRLGETKVLVKATGADVLELKSMQIYTKEGMQQLAPAAKKFNRYSGENPWNSKGCFRLWSNAVFTSDGRMVLCCYDKIPGYRIDSESNSYTQTWKSPRMNAMRKRILKGEKMPEICRNCAK